MQADGGELLGGSEIRAHHTGERDIHQQRNHAWMYLAIKFFAELAGAQAHRRARGANLGESHAQKIARKVETRDTI